METLENELELLISKVKNADNFCSEIENIQNVYPFNKYEYIITKLVEEKILSYDDYLELRNDYEGQVMITRENIASIQKFQVEGRALRQAIIEKYEE
ncbi:hypothetical protein GWP40_11930 [Treponema vincentii]|uniref:hypothetical protein n=1 Tax=Treponema TaxID=157 RepID=UPI001BB00292|nr:hypothetical protein [Treponema vincentii]QUY18879.1 hypothetical protein GWP40_11930 [Treponema vincentii]